MSYFTETSSNGEARKQFSHLFSAPNEVAVNGNPVAAMILDSSGTVRYCHADATRLFHASRGALVGRHIRELIPDLPFDRRTPGYNVAYAAFWAPDGPPRRFCGVDSRGRLFGLQVTLDRLELEKHQQILLNLRLKVLSGHSAEPCADRSERVDAHAGRSAETAFAD